MGAAVRPPRGDTLQWRWRPATIDTSFRPDHLHRAWGVAHDGLRHAAQEESGEPSSPVRAEHDHVRTPLRGGVQNCITRVTLTDGRIGTNSRGLELLCGARHEFFALTASFVADLQNLSRGGR